MKSENLTDYCAAGTTVTDQMLSLSDQISLRVITFTPAEPTTNPAVVFVAGWVSMIVAWRDVLREMTRDFVVYYLETREKRSAKVHRKAKFGVEAIGGDIATFISRLSLKRGTYILFGSSLGATAILDCCRLLEQKPRCLILIGPNAVFRVPRLGLAFIRLCPYYIYFLIRPLVKWYLRNFRLDLKTDYGQYQKYSDALDFAEPWRLKRALLALAKYTVWPQLPGIHIPALIVGASKDVLHEPENLKKIVRQLPQATYLDLETNKGTHSAVVVEEMRKFLREVG